MLCAKVLSIKVLCAKVLMCVHICGHHGTNLEQMRDYDNQPTEMTTATGRDGEEGGYCLGPGEECPPVHPSGSGPAPRPTTTTARG